MKLPPQPIKLIAIDIDGTLLNPQQRITPRTLASIRTAQQAGIVVTLATARRYSNSLQFADELGIDVPLITCDGALIIHHPQTQVLHTQTLAASIAQQAVEIMVQHRIQPIVHHINGTVEETWSGHMTFDNQELTTYIGHLPAIRRLPHATLCLGQPEPLRVVAFASAEAIEQMLPAIATLDCTWHTLKKGNYGCAEMDIRDKTCSKASGVIKLAQHLAIPLAQVMAIGDNTNDGEMLQAVGWGVAMGQAPASVKASAHAVTASNSEDGVALAIERYALLRDRYASSNSLKRVTCL